MLELLDDAGGYADSHIGYDLAPDGDKADSGAGGGFAFEERPAPVTSAAPSGGRNGGPGGSGGRRQAKKPGWELVKIIAGGLLAIPVAQLILWWLPGEWKRDPFKLGPVVGKAVPWLVPETFRAKDDDDDETKAPVKSKQQAAKNRKLSPRVTPVADRASIPAFQWRQGRSRS